jgi:hypothetical protein
MLSSYVSDDEYKKVLNNFFTFLSDFKSEDTAFEGATKTKIEKYINKITVLIEQFHNNIKDLYTAYVNYYTDTSSYEAFSNLNDAEVLINDIIAQFEVITNNIQSDIQEVKTKYSQTYSDANKSIQDVNYQSTSINRNMEVINTTNLMIDNSVDTYKSQYISNWIMIIGIILISTYLIKIFTNR